MTEGPYEADGAEGTEDQGVSGDVIGEAVSETSGSETSGVEGGESATVEPESVEADESKRDQAKLDELMRRYRATLRNESASGHAGFSAEYYREQKPPHW